MLVNIEELRTFFVFAANTTPLSSLKVYAISFAAPDIR